MLFFYCLQSNPRTCFVLLFTLNDLQKDLVHTFYCVVAMTQFCVAELYTIVRKGMKIEFTHPMWNNFLKMSVYLVLKMKLWIKIFSKTAAILLSTGKERKCITWIETFLTLFQYWCLIIFWEQIGFLRKGSIRKFLSD